MDEVGRTLGQVNTGSLTLREAWADFQRDPTQLHPLTVLRALAGAQQPREAYIVAIDNVAAVGLLRLAGLVAAEDFWHGDRETGRPVPHITPAGWDMLTIVAGMIDRATVAEVLEGRVGKQ